MTILDTIVAETRAQLQALRARVPAERLKAHAESLPPPRDFRAALQAHPDGGPRIIAELKRASPSRGVIRRDFGVISLARELEANGAAALSVLTEINHFHGSPRYLQAVAADVAVPVLRKDFIVDPYQVYEARAWGGDAILLIAAALEPDRFRALLDTARRLGLAVLAETHNAEELAMVLDAGADIVGINSRDLHTFATDLGTVEALLAKLPESVVAVAESGIRNAADITRLQAAGADAFLIGELLMRAPAPGKRLAELRATARGTAS